MPIGNDTFVTHGRLPHLQKSRKMYFVTFCAANRSVLPPAARDIVLEVVTRLHGSCCWIDVVVVMPDHVHIQFMPYDDVTVSRTVAQIKGRSSRHINRLLGRSGALWQRDSFDRIIRSDENRRAKAEYIANNAVRAGLVENAHDYRWLWMPPAG